MNYISQKTTYYVTTKKYYKYKDIIVMYFSARDNDIMDNDIMNNEHKAMDKRRKQLFDYGQEPKLILDR